MSLNVRTQNVYDAMTGNSWRLRKSKLAKVVREFVPDILSTQELEGGQAADLKDQMPSYGFVGAGRDDGRSGEMCGVFYRRNRLTKLRSGHFWLSDEPEVPGSSSWGAKHRRIATWLQLRRHSDGRVVFVFNTHFDNASKRARSESSRLIRAKIREIAGSAPAIITGDFNANEASEPYLALLEGEPGVDQRLEDSYRSQHARSLGGEGTYHGFTGSTAGGRIDWIVCTPHFHVCKAMIHHDEIDGKFPSDHFPISAIFRLGR